MSTSRMQMLIDLTDRSSSGSCRGVEHSLNYGRFLSLEAILPSALGRGCCIAVSLLSIAVLLYCCIAVVQYCSIAVSLPSSAVIHLPMQMAAGK